jgi:serine protease inhibitor
MGLHGSFISAWRHSARIDVDEESTKAAASTVVVMERSLLPAVEMIVDRPFHLAVVEPRSGLLIFLGRITEPEPLRG